MGSISKAFEPKSDQLNNIDLVSGSRTIKIRDAVLTGNDQQPLDIFYDGDNGKPYRPGKSMGRIIGYVWGDNEKDCIGQSMTLFRDPDVRFGSNKVGGIRISHMTGLREEKRFPMLIKRGVMGNYAIRPLNIEPQQPEKPQISAEDAMSDAKLAAGKGKDAFTAWWNSNKSLRELVRPNMSELSDIAATADSGAPTEDVSF